MRSSVASFAAMEYSQFGFTPIADLRKMLATKGPNPFDNVAFTLDGDQVRFKEYMTNGLGNLRET